jgi:hypothetical protein
MHLVYPVRIGLKSPFTLVIVSLGTFVGDPTNMHKSFPLDLPYSLN